MSTPVLVFVQNRAQRAGAQTSLSRLLASAALRSLQPVLVTGDDGWLARWCREHGIPCLVETFPRSRSLAGRLWRNAAFTRRIAARLRQSGLRAAAVVANDHQETLLARALAARSGSVPCAVILRSSGMDARHFRKYGCAGCDPVFAVGDALRQRAAGWHARPVQLYREGLSQEEFLPPLPWPAEPPRRVLVAGSENPGKGWADVLAALALLERARPDFSLDCDFTGSALPADGGARPQRSQLRLLGRVEDFRGLVRRYPLVIHPSRHESFGLAALEVLAAGVPLLCSRTGAIESVLQDGRYLFRPADPEDLAARLDALLQHWPQAAPDLAAAQAQLRQDLDAERTAAEVAGALAARMAMAAGR